MSEWKVSYARDGGCGTKSLIAACLAAQDDRNRRLELAALHLEPAAPVVVSSKRTMVWHGVEGVEKAAAVAR